MAVNNFELIKPLLEFRSSDDFYFINEAEKLTTFRGDE
jgi:hypothetical protein